ncbi:MAG: asparagine synthase-related protein, partial [Advenella sp.]
VIQGGKYVFTKNGVRRDFMSPCAVVQKDQSLISLLGDNLEAISREFEALTLHFSGGLDSSFLFAVMSHKNIDFEAEHHMPIEGEHSSEVNIAEDYCKKFNKELKKVTFDGTATLALPSVKIVNFPYDIPVYSVDSCREYRPRHCVVNGQGGDNVLLQNPPYMVGSDILKKSGIRLALKKIIQLSALKKSNFYKLLALNLLTYIRIWEQFTPYVKFPTWLPRSEGTQQQHHPLLHNHDPSSAKYEHIKRMLDSLYSTKQGNRMGQRSFSPLLFQNIIAFMIECECETTYNAQLDRLMPRKELSTLVDAPIITRTQKKPSTDLIFCLLHDNAKVFRDFLIGGRLVKKLKINVMHLNRSIIGNTETGLTDDLQFLLRLYQLESYFSPFPDTFFES